MAVTLNPGNAYTPTTGASLAAAKPHLLVAFEGNDAGWLGWVEAVGNALQTATESVAEVGSQFATSIGTTVSKLFDQGLKAAGAAGIVKQLLKAGVISRGKSDIENQRTLLKLGITAQNTAQLMAVMRGKGGTGNVGPLDRRVPVSQSQAMSSPAGPTTRQGVIDAAVMASTFTGAQAQKVNRALLHVMQQLGIKTNDPQGAKLFVATMNGATSPGAVALLKRAGKKDGKALTRWVYELAGLLPVAGRRTSTSTKKVAWSPAGRSVSSANPTPSSKRSEMGRQKLESHFEPGKGVVIRPEKHDLNPELESNKINETRQPQRQLPSVTTFPKIAGEQRTQASQPFPRGDTGIAGNRRPHIGSLKQQRNPFVEGSSPRTDALRSGALMTSNGNPSPEEWREHRAGLFGQVGGWDPAGNYYDSTEKWQAAKDASEQAASSQATPEAESSPKINTDKNPPAVADDKVVEVKRERGWFFNRAYAVDQQGNRREISESLAQELETRLSNVKEIVEGACEGRDPRDQCRMASERIVKQIPGAVQVRSAEWDKGRAPLHDVVLLPDGRIADGSIHQMISGGKPFTGTREELKEYLRTNQGRFQRDFRGMSADQVYDTFYAKLKAVNGGKQEDVERIEGRRDGGSSTRGSEPSSTLTSDGGRQRQRDAEKSQSPQKPPSALDQARDEIRRQLGEDRDFAQEARDMAKRARAEGNERMARQFEERARRLEGK